MIKKKKKSSHEDIWEESFPRKRYSKCKVPEVEVNWAYPEHRKKVGVTPAS